MTGWRLERGTTLQENGTVQFAVWAPKAERLTLRLAGNPKPTELLMHRGDDGVHTLDVTGLDSGIDYAYRIDGGPALPDPVSRYQPEGVHGWSRIVDPDAFQWTDAEWTGVPMADLVLYEIHVGTFTEEGTFAGVAKRLPYLQDLGITAISLMPVAEFPGSRGWGYDGVQLYAAHHAYGGPTGLKRLVDAAHKHGIAVILDVVYNHLGPEGNYLDEFGHYFTDRYHTPWGRAVNFDGAESDEVRRFVIDNALYWITECHIDGLRLDAVHAILDLSARHILEELATRVHEETRRGGRVQHVHVIAESDLNDPRLVRARAFGGFGLDAQWSDDFHHAVHAALTGERAGYYVDFGRTGLVAKALRDRFVVDGTYSRYRRRRHGAPASDLPAERFVVFIQNHDQVGNRARGDRLGHVVPHEQQKLAAALLLLGPYVPLLFMGEEHAEPNPFLYFVSHGDPSLVQAVRQGREREFRAFGWTGEIPDPADVATFLRSRISWTWDEAPQREVLHDLYRELLEIRRAEPALRPGAARWQVDSDDEKGWITMAYEARRSAPLVAVFNLSPIPAVARISAAPGSWHLRVSTDSRRFGGAGGPDQHLEISGPLGGASLSLPPSSAALYRREGS